MRSGEILGIFDAKIWNPMLRGFVAILSVIVTHAGERSNLKTADVPKLP